MLYEVITDLARCSLVAVAGGARQLGQRVEIELRAALPQFLQRRLHLFGIAEPVTPLFHPVKGALLGVVALALPLQVGSYNFV